MLRMWNIECKFLCNDISSPAVISYVNPVRIFRVSQFENLELCGN